MRQAANDISIHSQITQSAESRQNPTNPDTAHAASPAHHAHPSSPNPSPLHAGTESRELCDRSAAPELSSPSATPRPLSLRQHQAIALLLAGHSDAKTARKVGVTRPTICDWRNHHPAFIAELNRQRQRRHSATADRYDRLLNRAMQFIEDFQDAYDDELEDQKNLATTLLRSAAARHALRPATAGPTNPDDVLQQLLADDLPISPDDSPANDAPPPPPPPPKKTRKR